MLKQTIIIFLLCAIIAAQESCSNYWQYARGPEEIEGVVTVAYDKSFTDHHIKVILTVTSRLPSSYVGSISLYKDRQTTINDISSGIPVQFRIKFPLQEPLAKLIGIMYNNQQLCTSPKEAASYVTTITLDHSLFTRSTSVGFNTLSASQSIQSFPNQNSIGSQNQNYQPAQNIPETQNYISSSGQNSQSFQNYNLQGSQNQYYQPQTHQSSQNQNYQPQQTQNYQPQQNQNYQPQQSQNYQPQQSQNYQPQQSQSYQPAPSQIFRGTSQQNYQSYNGAQNQNQQKFGSNSNYQQYSPNPYSNNIDNFFNTLGTVKPTVRPTQSYQQQNQPQQFIQTQTVNTVQCGIPLRKFSGSKGLVTHGQAAYKGQFPWLAVFYYNSIHENGFICGGSLISSRAVVTAAHCVHDKHDSPKRPEGSIFYVGKHYINSILSERGFVFSVVERFSIHPDWNHLSDSYDADIAIALLARTIPFSNFIKPICLWTATSNYYDIINHHGVIAGYGKTEATASTSDKPYWTGLPVVDEGTCLRSNNDFAKITSRRTFCAGTRDGRGPCSGDSGGGLIINNNGQWYLRGIISSSLLDPVLYTCDTKNYAIFTDVAAYTDWIKRHM